MTVTSTRLDKGYDSDLECRVIGFLIGRQRPALRDLNVNVDQGVVTISGRVGTFYEKQLALNCCQRVAGVLKLVDRVAVA